MSASTRRSTSIIAIKAPRSFRLSLAAGWIRAVVVASLLLGVPQDAVAGRELCQVVFAVTPPVVPSTTTTTTSTSVTTTTSTSTTTTTPPTSTTMVADPGSLSIATGVAPDETGTTVATMDFEVVYARPKIFFPDSKGEVRCVGIPTGSVAGAVDDLARATLTVAFSAGLPAVAPAPLVRCDLYPSSIPTDEDFSLRVLAGADAHFQALDPLLEMVVDSIVCGSAVTTTTTTTTTTSMPHSTLTTTTTTLAPETCRLVVGLDDAVELRRLGLVVDHAGAGGRMGPLADCENLAPAAASFVNEAQAKALHVNFLQLDGFSGPSGLFDCPFIPTHFVAEPQDFVIDVVLSEAFDGGATVALPGVSLRGFTCPSMPTTTSTTTSSTTTTTVPVTTTTFPSEICADADGDGQVQTDDALRVLMAAVGIEIPCPPARCDVDGDGVLTAADALAVLFEAVAREVVLACP